MDRDALLAAALGAAVLTGCTSSAPPGPGPSALPAPSTPPADPDVAVLQGWVRQESRLADRYGTGSRAVPALAALRDNHRARAEAVAEHLAVRGAPLPRGGPGVAALRGRPAAVVAALAKGERELATHYLRALASVSDPKVAVLGAELAAGARQHAALLALLRVPA